MSSPSTFLAQAADYPHLLERIVQTRPEVLNSDHLLNIDLVNLRTLVSFLPEHGRLTESVIDRLLLVEDSLLARQTFLSYPGPTMLALTRHINFAPDRSEISQVWLSGLVERSDLYLDGDYLSLLCSTSAIAHVAGIFGYDNNAILKHGPAPWLKAIRGARVTASGDKQQLLYAFLMVLALAKPVRGAEVIFELTFETLHSLIAKSSLNRNAFNMLVRYLPDLWWWRQWDTCLRLRQAVVEAYASGGLDDSSFGRLASDRATQKLLNETKRDMRD